MNTYANTSDGRARPNEPETFKGLDSDLVAVLNRQLAEIKKRRNERRLASQRVTDAVKDTLAHGFDKQTLAFLVRLSEMEPDDREEFLHRLDEYATKLRYY